MIVLAGFGIESGSLFVHEEGADLALLDEIVKVAINRGETDPRQLLVNPSVDLMGERVGVVALDSCEHLLQLTCFAFAGGPPHRLPRILAMGRSERQCVRVIKTRDRCQGLATARCLPQLDTTD